MVRRKKIGLIILLLPLLAIVNIANALEFEESQLQLELEKVKYSTLSMAYSVDEFSDSEKQLNENFGQEIENSEFSKKSPTKAFLLSLAVPGLGQYYNGSKVKSFIFFGAEVAGIYMNIKFNDDGDKLTDVNEAYSLQHWSRDDYTTYLYTLWGQTSDTAINDVTHHLPTTNTQQYYEMTGKYNQFAWGWDDASIGGLSFQDFIDGGDLVKITGDDNTIPTSSRRLQYETMRNDANNKFDKAKQMTYMIMFNHIISAFEALISTNKHNKAMSMSEHEFSQLKIRGAMKSSYSKWDTPYIKITYKL